MRDVDNRLKDFFREEEQLPEPENEFFEVAGRGCWFYTDAETAAYVKRQLSRFWKPAWLQFTDLFGSEVNLRPSDIRFVTESTPEQREKLRAWVRSREKEEKEDPHRWED